MFPTVVLSAAISTPSTVPDTVILPVTLTPALVTSNFVLPPDCILRSPVPASLIIESLALWNISKSEPVPSFNLALS